MRRIFRLSTSVGWSVLVVAVLAGGAIAERDAAPAAPGAIALDETTQADRTLINKLLDSPHWPFRVFALLRLERFAGADRDELIRARLGDGTWQVRRFAIRAAHRARLSLPDDPFADETDGRVIRAALKHGFAVDEEHAERAARKLMRTGDPDDLLLGLEIAGMTQRAALRAESIRRTRRFVRRMNDALVVRYGDRLARIVGAEPAPESAQQWRAWLDAKRGTLPLAALTPADDVADAPLPIAAELDADGFSRLVDYLDSLRQQDLELVVVMDSTMSMVPMIDEARSGVDTLILFLADISRTMRLAFVAYRDHDNPPVCEGHPFTDDVRSIRKFLYDVRITGGRDLPEAVFDGLDACTKLDWTRDATRQVVLVGDARPHDDDGYRLTGLLETFQNSGVVVHVAHVPMRMNEVIRVRMSPEQVLARQQQIAEHNELTREAFADIAREGGGDLISLDRSRDLVPSIMHFTIAETWWPAFDEFYAMYLELCRS